MLEGLCFNWCYTQIVSEMLIWRASFYIKFYFIIYYIKFNVINSIIIIILKRPPNYIEKASEIKDFKGEA